MAPRKTAAVADPDDWQTVQPDDWQTVSPTTSSGFNTSITPDMATDGWKAAVHGRMLDTPTDYALQNKDVIDQQMRARDPKYDDMTLEPTIANDFKSGYEGSVLGLIERQTNKQGLPQRVRNPGMIDKFISTVGGLIGDAPAMVAGALAGGAAGSEVPVVGNVIGGGAGAFALPAIARQALIEGMTKGTVTSFSDILRRMANVVKAGGKGAAVGAATELAGGIPVGSFIAKSGLATTGMKSMYQVAAITTTADLLEGKVPELKGFAGNAALIIPLNLITHGVALREADTNRALMDVYAKDGKTPAESTESLHAQPPVKPDLPEGLRPAIQTGDGHVAGEADESHADVAERVLATRPVSMEQLEADPDKADDVLQNPTIHEQDVIDRAWQLKSEAIESGSVGGQKPLYEMSQEELEAERKEASNRDNSDLVALFGEEGAKRYKSLSRKADSSTDLEGADRASEQIQDMESGLTKEQQNRLYGIGDTRHQLDDINEYRSALGRIDGGSPEALADSLKWAVSQIDDPSTPVEEMTPKQQVRYAQLRHAFEIAQQNGWDTSAIIKKAIGAAAERFPDPEDAIAVLEKVARSVGEPSLQPALPGATEPKPSYEVVPNKLPDTPGKFHIRSIGESDTVKAEKLASRGTLVYENEADAQATLGRKNLEAQTMKERMSPKTGEEKPLTFDDLYDRASLKSGRGFVTPDGEFLSRMEARKWVKDNEPDVHEMWLQEQDGDKQASFHSEDYGIARMRVSARNVAEGDPVVDNLPPEIKRMLAEARSETGILNKVKAGLKSVKYGFEAIRTLLTGPRDYFRAEGEQIVSQMRKAVPDPLEQQALHFARDYRGEPEVLREAIEEVRSGDNEKLKAFIPAMERALEPMSPAMAAADEQMTAYFKQQLDRGRALGTLDSAVDPSRYSPRMFMRATEEGTTGLGRPRFTDKTVNALRREYLHTLDPLQSGDTEARTFNAFDEMSIYSDRMAIANSTALFIRELKNSALGVVSSGDKVPADWVRLTRQFEDRRTFVQDDGSSVTTVKNLYVPKDIADALQPLLEEGGTPAKIAKFLHIQSVIKGVELSLSAFHIKALNVTALNNLGLRDYLGAWNFDSDAADTQAIERRGSVYGLVTTKTGVPFDAYRGLQPKASDSGLLAGLKDNAVVEGANKFMEGTSKYIFDTVQRKFKVMDFAKKEAGWIANNPDATESQYSAAMKGYAKEINAAYGGLNWDVMGVSKGMQSISRLFLLAPDWTFSNVVNAKYALTDSGTAGAASRAFFMKSFITGFAATAAMSIYVGGKYDPTDVKHLDQVYLGTDKDGKEMYSNIFFAGAPKDLISLAKRSYATDPVTGLAETIVGKASPILGGVIDLGKNKDFRGRPISKPGDSGLKRTGESGLYLGEKLIPITGETPVEMLKSALTQPGYSPSYQDILDILAGAAGSPVYHEGSSGGTAKRQPLPGEGKSTKATTPLGRPTRRK